MNAINYLRQIKVMDAKINADIEELAQLEALATKTTSAIGGERVQTSGSQEKMADCITKIVDMQNQITKEIDKFIEFKDEARKLICDACDPECISLLHKRYIMYKKWEEIAVEMDFTYQWVSGGLHQRALSQVQIKLDKKMTAVDSN